ncbi:hypothetical protein V8D89_016357, partial [Ganoderma adspersum]
EMMMDKWDSPIYVFFEPVLELKYVDECCSHVFQCSAHKCGTQIHRFLDSKDRSSTGNLQCHIWSCWDDKAVNTACMATNIKKVQEKIISALLQDGLIMAAFEQKKGEGKVMYSHGPHTRTETCMEIVQWVAESQRPFKIVHN